MGKGRHTPDAIRQRCAIFQFSKANKSVYNRKLWYLWKVDEPMHGQQLKFYIIFTKIFLRANLSTFENKKVGAIYFYWYIFRRKTFRLQHCYYNTIHIHALNCSKKYFGFSNVFLSVCQTNLRSHVGYIHVDVFTVIQFLFT